jgi:hypothetical protein
LAAEDRLLERKALGIRQRHARDYARLRKRKRK